MGKLFLTTLGIVFLMSFAATEARAQEADVDAAEWKACQVTDAALRNHYAQNGLRAANWAKAAKPMLSGIHDRLLKDVAKQVFGTPVQKAALKTFFDEMAKLPKSAGQVRLSDQHGLAIDELSRIHAVALMRALAPPIDLRNRDLPRTGGRVRREKLEFPERSVQLVAVDEPVISTTDNQEALLEDNLSIDVKGGEVTLKICSRFRKYAGTLNVEGCTRLPIWKEMKVGVSSTQFTKLENFAIDQLKPEGSDVEAYVKPRLGKSCSLALANAPKALGQQSRAAFPGVVISQDKNVPMAAFPDEDLPLAGDSSGSGTR